MSNEHIAIVNTANPKIKTAGKTVLVDLRLNLLEVKALEINWQVKLSYFIPKIDITLSEVRKAHTKGENYIHMFSIDKDISFDEVDQPGNLSVIGYTSFGLLINEGIMPGWYSLRFAGSWEGRGMKNTFEFSQKILIQKIHK